MWDEGCFCYHCDVLVLDEERHYADRTFCGESRECLMAEQIYYIGDPRHV